MDSQLTRGFLKLQDSRDNIAIEYEVPTLNPPTISKQSTNHRTSTRREVIISSGHPLIRPYQFAHKPLSVLRQHFPPINSRPYNEHEGVQIDQPLTGAFVIGGLFLFVILVLVIAAIIFSKKKNTVFAYQKSSRDDDFSLELDDFGSSDYDDIDDSSLLDETSLDRINKTSHVKWHPSGKTFHTIDQNLRFSKAPSSSRNNLQSFLNYFWAIWPQSRFVKDNSAFPQHSACYSVRRNKLRLAKSFSCQSSFNYDVLEQNSKLPENCDFKNSNEKLNIKSLSRNPPCKLYNHELTNNDSDISRTSPRILTNKKIDGENIDLLQDEWSSFVLPASSPL